jgi:hypothetical protein
MEGLINTMDLHGKEVFLLTDNSAFEGTFYKGHSSSEKLSDIILRLRILQQRSGCIIHVIHIAGTCMKAAGIDGLSRGDLLEGMMQSTTDPWRFIRSVRRQMKREKIKNEEKEKKNPVSFCVASGCTRPIHEHCVEKKFCYTHALIKEKCVQCNKNNRRGGSLYCAICVKV